MDGLFEGLDNFFEGMREMFYLLPDPIQVLTIGGFGIIILIVLIKDFVL